VDEVVALEVEEGFEEFEGVDTDGTDAETVAAALFEELAEVEVHGFEDETEVVAVFELGEETDVVVFGIGVGFAEFLENFGFFFAGAFHVGIVSDEFNGNFLIVFGSL